MRYALMPSSHRQQPQRLPTMSRSAESLASVGYQAAAFRDGQPEALASYPAVTMTQRQELADLAVPDGIISRTGGCTDHQDRNGEEPAERYVSSGRWFTGSPEGKPPTS